MRCTRHILILWMGLVIVNQHVTSPSSFLETILQLRLHNNHECYSYYGIQSLVQLDILVRWEERERLTEGQLVARIQS